MRIFVVFFIFLVKILDFCFRVCHTIRIVTVENVFFCRLALLPVQSLLETEIVLFPKSIIDAVKIGIWDFEPTPVNPYEYASTDALPGTPRKIEILARRLREGEPLWHPEDRIEADALAVLKVQ